MDALSQAFLVIYIILYPLIYLLHRIFALLYVVSAPLRLLGNFLLRLCLYPLHILAKLEVDRPLPFHLMVA